MFKIYTCIADDHDAALLLVSCLICAFGSLISLSAGRRALLFAGGERRRRLCLAGLATGMTIWSTHFSAMLAYSPGVEIRFNGPAALASASLAVLIAGCAWFILAVPGRWRRYAGGGLIGLALCAAHFTDMSALHVEGIAFYDRSLVALAVVLGFPFCVASGVLLQGAKHRPVLWAAACLSVGTMALHLVAMSAVRIVPTATTSFSQLDLGLGGLTLLVIASSTFVLLLGAGLALHDLELARATALDRERLRRSEEHHRYSVELNPQIPWIADERGQVIEISSRWASVVGLPVHKAIGSGWLDNVHPDDAAKVRAAWGGAIARGSDEEADVRYRLRRAEGDYRWFRARARPRRDETGKIIMWYGNLEDIHEQVSAELALRASEERYRYASLATNDVIWDVRVGSGYVEWSGAVGDVLGYPEARAGTSREWWMERLHPDEREEVLEQLRVILGSDVDSWTQEFRFRTKAGHYVDLLSRGYVERDAARKPVRMVGSLMDITARKRSEDELRWAAHHDPLTRLPNRKLFSMNLDAALGHARQNGGSVGLIVIDVDGFKTLNDTLGHAAGDAALTEVARRLSDRVPAEGTVARLGGDEFAIILPGLAEAADASLERILGGMDAHFTFEGRQIDLSLSVGAASFPADGADSEGLLKSADLALYAAKAGGAGNARSFRPSMREAAENEKRMLVNAREALLNQQIVPYYQPKISLRTGEIVGFEALLRWSHGERGIQPPAAIQAAFEDPRVGPELTDRMLSQVIADMARWLDAGHLFGRIAVNGSPEDFRRGDLSDRILGGLTEAGVLPTRFELEITETVFLGKHADEVGAALRALRYEGVRIALDDFGTGYASLTHLKEFAVDALKIDQSFVSRLVSDEQQDALIIGALIDLAKNLGIETVAEGVETELQAFMLRRRGCDVGQGYVFARPLPSCDVPGFIAGWRAERMLADWKFATA